MKSLGRSDVDRVYASMWKRFSKRARDNETNGRSRFIITYIRAVPVNEKVTSLFHAMGDLSVIYYEDKFIKRNVEITGAHYGNPSVRWIHRRRIKMDPDCDGGGDNFERDRTKIPVDYWWEASGKPIPALFSLIRMEVGCTKVDVIGGIMKWGTIGDQCIEGSFPKRATRFESL